MKQLFIVGNWKSNQTIAEADDWLETFNATWKIGNRRWGNTTVILCVSFTLLYFVKQRISQLQLPIELGAQDVSAFDSGAYTGEVNATQLGELCSWVIVGHSERRKYFHEDDALHERKASMAKAGGLSTIFCTQNDKTPVPTGVDIVAYEPVWAVGTGNPETPEAANTVIAAVKAKTGLKQGIYGGSVTADNVADFVRQPAVDGVLPGGASLEALHFYELIAAARTATS